MANKWQTAIANSLWVKESYSDDPQNPSATILVRAIYGIARTNTEDILVALNATKSVTNPVVNGKLVSGTFRVIKNESRPASGQSLEGSDVIIQTLGDGFFTTLSASNKFVVKHNYEIEEQNENAWMYYARGTVIETSRWMNIASTSIASLYPYTTSVAFDVSISGYDTPVIQENWYEREQDGSYSMYRTLFARATTATAKYRTIQYAGMILTDADTPPAEMDTTIKLSGFRNTTETIYANAKFSIGGDTYRVTANATAVAGVVTVSIVPEVTLSTETYCEDNAMQVYFESVS
jgi:hypothetical protein